MTTEAFNHWTQTFVLEIDQEPGYSAELRRVLIEHNRKWDAADALRDRFIEEFDDWLEAIKNPEGMLQPIGVSTYHVAALQEVQWNLVVDYYKPTSFVFPENDERYKQQDDFSYRLRPEYKDEIAEEHAYYSSDDYDENDDKYSSSR